MKTLCTQALTALFTLALIVPMAGAGEEFVAYGFADYVPAVDEVNAVVEVYGVITDIGDLNEPLPLDYDNFEYTVRITQWVVASVANPLPSLRSVEFTGGIVELFADAKVGGTMADYADRSTFADGDLFLAGALQDNFLMTLFDNNLDGLYSGSGSGGADMTGGSRLDELSGLGYLLTDWSFVAILVADDGVGPGISVPAGYDRVCDIKLVPPTSVATESATWGAVKDLYR